MAFELVTIPCLSDNYAYLLIKDGEAVVVDVPEAAPLLAAVAERGVKVRDVILTHHHFDHVQGLDEVKEGLGTPVRVIGCAADADRLPALDLALGEGDALQVLGADVQVFDVSGHTLGHLAFYVPEAGVAFTADSLMALGCGRVFEGTMDQMWAGLQKLAALPGETVIASGHEYTEANGRFALTIEPENQALQDRMARIRDARAEGRPTVPSTLSEELATNPFLRAHLAEVKKGLNMVGNSDPDVFGEIRRRKDSF
ncbi:MAG: hydroxyacylglutathione hydrolase [Silicimonas sp.]|nr:hydroxyacylglutathione hydrolase [Silicimonas sp.]